MGGISEALAIPAADTEYAAADPAASAAQPAVAAVRWRRQEKTDCR
jgi:hypothetical protein